MQKFLKLLQSWGRATLVCALVVALSGCESICEDSLTARVWTSGDFQHFREPATSPRVQVFADEQRKDFLVTYVEVRDTTEAPRLRAFYLGENTRRLLERRKPKFVDPKIANNLQAVSVNGKSQQVPFARFDNELTVHTDQGDIGPFSLPTYEVRSGVAARVMLTPFAVAGDVVIGAVIVGSVVGLAYLYSAAHCDSH